MLARALFEADRTWLRLRAWAKPRLTKAFDAALLGVAFILERRKP